MRAAVLSEYGLPRCDNFDEPVATGEQLVVDVEAAGINPVDVLTSSGRFYIRPPVLPCVVGLDGVGRLGDGRRVYFEATVPPFGAAAERALVAPEALVDLPEGLDAATGAALGNSGIAALMSLQWRARLTPGETVLVLGATGTVGRLAVQIAKLLGAGVVVAAGRDRDRLGRAGELGADKLVALGDADAEERLREATGSGADVILDLLWGHWAAAAARAAAPSARLVQVGNSADPEATLPAGEIRSSGIDLLGYANFHLPRERRHWAYRCLVEHAAAARIVVDLERVGLKDVERAWRRQGTGAEHKLVLTPGAA